MIAGMLWFDNDPKTTLSAKVERAVDYYRHKYGREPNVCFVHPKALENGNPNVKILVRPYRVVLPGHLWIGIEDKNE